MAVKKLLAAKHKAVYDAFINPDHIVKISNARDGGSWITTTEGEMYYSPLTPYDIKDELGWKVVGNL